MDGGVVDLDIALMLDVEQHHRHGGAREHEMEGLLALTQRVLQLAPAGHVADQCDDAVSAAFGIDRHGVDFDPSKTSVFAAPLYFAAAARRVPGFPTRELPQHRQT